MRAATAALEADTSADGAQQLSEELEAARAGECDGRLQSRLPRWRDHVLRRALQCRHRQLSLPNSFILPILRVASDGRAHHHRPPTNARRALCQGAAAGMAAAAAADIRRLCARRGRRAADPHRAVRSWARASARCARALRRRACRPIGAAKSRTAPRCSHARANSST